MYKYGDNLINNYNLKKFDEFKSGLIFYEYNGCGYCQNEGVYYYKFYLLKNEKIKNITEDISKMYDCKYLKTSGKIRNFNYSNNLVKKIQQDGLKILSIQ